MEKHDDAPEDVKRATSIEVEIKKGEKDDTFEGYPRVQEKKKRWEHCKDTPPKKSKANRRSLIFSSIFIPFYFAFYSAQQNRTLQDGRDYKSLKIINLIY